MPEGLLQGPCRRPRSARRQQRPCPRLLVQACMQMPMLSLSFGVHNCCLHVYTQLEMVLQQRFKMERPLVSHSARPGSAPTGQRRPPRGCLRRSRRAKAPKHGLRKCLLEAFHQVLQPRQLRLHLSELLICGAVPGTGGGPLRCCTGQRAGRPNGQRAGGQGALLLHAPTALAAEPVLHGGRTHGAIVCCRPPTTPNRRAIWPPPTAAGGCLGRVLVQAQHSTANVDRTGQQLLLQSGEQAGRAEQGMWVLGASLMHHCRRQLRRGSTASVGRLGLFAAREAFTSSLYSPNAPHTGAT